MMQQTVMKRASLDSIARHIRAHLLKANNYTDKKEQHEKAAAHYLGEAYGRIHDEHEIPKSFASWIKEQKIGSNRTRRLMLFHEGRDMEAEALIEGRREQSRQRKQKDRATRRNVKEIQKRVSNIKQLKRTPPAAMPKLNPIERKRRLLLSIVRNADDKTINKIYALLMPYVEK